MDFTSEVTYAYNIKIIILSIGIVFFFAAIYFYHRSIFKTEADVKASFGSWTILVRRAAPGTLFLIASTIIIAIGAAKKMSSTFSTKYQLDKNELRNSIESLKIDSSSEATFNRKFNIDSLIRISSSQATKKKFLNALKTLYLAKGLLYSDTTKNSDLQRVNQQIALVESFLNEQLNNLPKENNSEQTRATNINSTGNDSIR